MPWIITVFLFITMSILTMRDCLFDGWVKFKSYNEYTIDEIYYLYEDGKYPYYNIYYTDENKIQHSKQMGSLRDGYLNFCLNSGDVFHEDVASDIARLGNRIKFFNYDKPFKQIIVRDLPKGTKGYARVIEFHQNDKGVNNCRSFYAEIHLPDETIIP